MMRRQKKEHHHQKKKKGRLDAGNSVCVCEKERREHHQPQREGPIHLILSQRGRVDRHPSGRWKSALQGGRTPSSTVERAWCCDFSCRKRIDREKNQERSESRGSKTTTTKRMRPFTLVILSACFSSNQKTKREHHHPQRGAMQVTILPCKNDGENTTTQGIQGRLPLTGDGSLMLMITIRVFFWVLKAKKGRPLRLSKRSNRERGETATQGRDRQPRSEGDWARCS